MMRYAAANPYWMVPAALQGTQQTLKDLVTTHFAQQQAEQGHQLKLAELDLARQRMGMTGERDLAETALQAAKVRSDADWRQKEQAARHAESAATREYRRDELGLRRDELGLRQAANARQESEFRRRQQEQTRMNRPADPKAAAAAYGLGSLGTRLLQERMGDGVRPLREYGPAVEGLMQELQKSPKLAAAAMLDSLEPHLNQLFQKAEAGESLSSDERQSLAEAGKMLRTLDILTQDAPMKAEDVAEVMENSGYTWDAMAAEKQKDPSAGGPEYDQYMKQAKGDAARAKQLYQKNAVREVNRVRTGSVLKDDLERLSKQVKTLKGGPETPKGETPSTTTFSSVTTTSVNPQAVDGVELLRRIETQAPTRKDAIALVKALPPAQKKAVAKALADRERTSK